MIQSYQYTISKNGIAPAGVMPAGSQGDHNIAELVFTLEPSLKTELEAWESDGYSLCYRVDAVDGAGNYLPSDLLSESSGEIHYPLCAELLSAGGLARVHLVASRIKGASEERVFYAKPALLSIERVESAGQANVVNGISGALNAAAAAAESAEDSAESCAQAAESCAQSAEIVSGAAQATEAANAAASAAQSAATEASAAADAAETLAGQLEDLIGETEDLFVEAAAAEAERSSAEAERVAAEQTRQQAEAAREEAEADREQAEAERSEAAAKAPSTYANALKGSASGHPATFDDVCPVQHEMDVRLEAKNLIQYPYAETTTTENGITFTDNGDGTVTVNGTATGDAAFGIANAVPTGTYRLSGCPAGGSSGTYCLYVDSPSTADTGSGYTATFADASHVIGIAVRSGVTVENLTFAPKLEVTSFDGITLTRCGKNLYDCSVVTDSGKAELLDEATGEFKILNTGGIPETPIAAKENTRYYVSGWIKGTLDTQRINISVYYTDDTNLNIGADVTNTEYTYVGRMTDAGKTVRGIRFGSAGGIRVGTQYKQIQVELASAATDYAPYDGQTCEASADGTVEGVTSAYPSTTLTTDSDEVTIHCDYNKDLNLAFASLLSRIEALETP